MADKKRKVPGHLKPFIFHGVDLDWDEGDTQAKAECPFCNHPKNKFEVEIDTGKWGCWNCDAGHKDDSDEDGGNIPTFLHHLWEVSDRNTSSYKDLADDRSLNPDTLLKWGVSKSVSTGDWVVPGWAENSKGDIVVKQLYQYCSLQGKMTLLSTPKDPDKNVQHQLFGLGPIGVDKLFHEERGTIYLCEGPWDAMALWEVLGACRIDEGDVKPTLLDYANVLAVPGVKSFNIKWAHWFEDKDVVLMYDNDHPHKNDKTGKLMDPAALIGLRRATRVLVDLASSVNYLCWSPSGGTYAEKLPRGYDIRDALFVSPGALGTLPGVKRSDSPLKTILGMVKPVPQEWIEASKGKDKPEDSEEVEALEGQEGLESLACDNYRPLSIAWRKALKWTPGLDHALTVMLATIASTKLVGDQLWIKVIGPAGCGKTTLCEAVSVSQRFTLPKSTIRGFMSGYRIEGGGRVQDHGLIPLVMNKTLVTKDGDALLQAPNLRQILSEARDLYDSVFRSHYRNAQGKDYRGIRMTWILCGTESLRSLDSSELGERFLDCLIMDEIDDDLEDDILWKVIHRTDSDLAIESDGKADTQYNPRIAKAMKLTGGYVDWLRTHAVKSVYKIKFSTGSKYRCARLGKFVANMRARPVKDKDYEVKPQRELAARLASQHIRLAKCLAYVLNRDEVDSEVLGRVTRVALDTARGQTLDIIKQLYKAGAEGMKPRELSVAINESDNTTRKLLRFLKVIKLVNNSGSTSNLRWRLTGRIQRLYREVMDLTL